jgi:hypothetical protein
MIDFDDIENMEDYINESKKNTLIAVLLAVKKIVEVSDNKQSVMDAIDDIVNEIEKIDDSKNE